MSNKVAILGIGYLGYNIAESLNSKGFDVSVFGFSNDYTKRLHKGIRFVETDIANELIMNQELEESCEVIYTAGSIYANESIDSLYQDVQENYLKFLDVLKICNNKKAKRFIFLSSSGAIYGLNERTNDENSPLNPVVIYGLQKLFFEKVIQINQLENELPFLILRISNAYGGFQDEQRNQGIIPILIRKIINDEPFDLWSSLDTERDFIYISDITCAICELLDTQTTNEVYNIASSDSISLKDLIAIIENGLDKKLTVNEQKIRSVNIPKALINNEKAKNELGFKINCSIQEGVAKEIERISLKKVEA